jgi:predicted RNA-binding protein with PUA-like domain
MATFILKTEPSTYSFDDLVRDKQTAWTGVSNPVALANIRSMKKGDEALIYHTGDEKALVGLAQVIKEAYEDPDQPGVNSKGEPKFAVVDLKALRKVKTQVALAAVKADKRFAAFPLVTQPRLSVIPVPADLDAALRQMTGL